MSVPSLSFIKIEFKPEVCALLVAFNCVIFITLHSKVTAENENPRQLANAVIYYQNKPCLCGEKFADLKFSVYMWVRVCLVRTAHLIVFSAWYLAFCSCDAFSIGMRWLGLPRVKIENLPSNGRSPDAFSSLKSSQGNWMRKVEKLHWWAMHIEVKIIQVISERANGIEDLRFCPVQRQLIRLCLCPGSSVTEVLTGCYLTPFTLIHKKSWVWNVLMLKTAW